MCGISGSWNLDRSIVEQMNIHQNSRGPDNTGICESDKVIFGHNRLAIVDQSDAGNQPMTQTKYRDVTTKDSIEKPELMEISKNMISYNGEIYNYEAYRFRNDTAWLLSKLIDGKLTAVLNSLGGMFAFGYYDSRTEIITIVRDRFGIKPLYYTHQKDFFAFASTPAALSLTKSSWQVSKKGVQEYLALGATTLHSMFEGIEAVPPGYYLTFNCKTQESKLTRWYYPKFIENAFEKIEESVINAIDRVKLTCDWPQIILLSGGIDSSLVASRYTGQKAIHLASPEQAEAQRVADRFGIELFNVSPEIENAEECLRDYISKSGDPTMAGLIPYITCKEIKKLGYQVAITANGADELFFGYDRMKNQSEQWRHILRDFSFTKEIITDIFTRLTVEKQYTDQWFEICTYLMFDLNKTLDFASMCHSVEVRVPYLDHELVEAALSIPQSKHVANFGNKTILKKMLVDLGFDFGFIHRPKIGFSLHQEPSDWRNLQDKAMKWYKTTDYEQLGEATGRQEAYHAYTVTGLYLWHQIHRKY